MKRKITILRLLCLFMWAMTIPTTSTAQRTYLILNDSSKLEGYISMQQPGKGMQFYASRAIRRVSISQLSNSPQEVWVPLNQLPDDWIWWAERNHAFETNNGQQKGLKMLTLQFKHPVRTDTVMPIEHTASHIVYMDFPNRDIDLNWDEINHIEKTPRTARTNEGLDDLIILNDGTKLQGQVIAQVPGISLTLLLSSGRNLHLQLKDIAQSSKVAVNPAKSLWSQRPYNNIIDLKSGTQMKGLIVEQHTGETPEDNFLLLLTPSGYTEQIPFNQVERYRSIPIQ